MQQSYNTPIPEPSGYIPPVVSSGANDSGTGSSAVLPEGLKGFNWGACFLTWIWAIGHRFWLGLLVLLVPILVNLLNLNRVSLIINIVIMVLFGVKGNEWAWQNRQWNDHEHFRSTERVWAIWGIALFAIAILLLVLAFVLLGGLIFSAIQGNSQAFQPPVNIQPR